MYHVRLSCVIKGFTYLLTLAMDDILDVFALPTQRQNNGTDRGCHAVATAVEFLHEDGDPTADFAVERIREHGLH